MYKILSVKNAIAAIFLILMSCLALAQSFPSKTVRLVVPFPAGSATDMAARLTALYLQTAMNQNFVVENKPGAGGSIAAMEVIRSNPDGYTLLFSSNSAAAANVALLKNISYDPNKDFTPIAGIGENTLVLMVKSDHPAKNIQEFISYASQRPGKVNAGYGSSSSQLSIAVLNKLAKIDTMMVPYKGIPLAVNDVLAGVVEFSFVDQGNAMAQSKGGKMRVLGVTSNTRSMLAPDWPALSETLTGFDINGWFAVLGPAGIPKDVVEKLNTQITNILKQNEFKEKMASIGLQTMPMTHDQLKSHIASEVTKWIRLVKEASIQPE